MMRARQPGFSLIELLISVLIGTLAMVFVMRTTIGFETDRRGSIGGSDSMQNGVVALFSMENDAAQSGWGLNDGLLLGCAAKFFDSQDYLDSQNYNKSPARDSSAAGGIALTLAPVSVVFNGADPDVISFASGTSDAGTGSAGLAVSAAAGSASLIIDQVPFGFKFRDALAIAPTTAGGTCAIAQVSGVVQTPPTLNIANDGTTATRFNSTGGLLSAFAGPNQAKVFNLGDGVSLSFHTWDVNKGVLRLRATDLSGASNAPVRRNVRRGWGWNRWRFRRLSTPGRRAPCRGGAQPRTRETGCRRHHLSQDQRPGRSRYCDIDDDPVDAKGVRVTGTAWRRDRGADRAADPGERRCRGRSDRLVMLSLPGFRNHRGAKELRMETLTAQRGVALPIALIMLVVMLFSGIYLMRASNNATLMSSNLAYQRDISRRADYGLSLGYNYLSTTAITLATKGNLDSDQLASGYISTYSCVAGNCNRDAAFWANSVTTNDLSGNPVEYVIHRMCQYPVAYNAKFGALDNQCVQTTAVAPIGAGGAVAGTSLSSDAEAYTTLPQIHYVITARVPGVKGASVINQMVVMIGA
jgi:prepilin-type N-terminal cleavage/methylation domain-containing protein